MNISDISASQLRQAASLKDQIQSLENQVAKILGSATTATTPKPAKKKGKMSQAGRANIVAAQKARWAKQKGTKAPKAKGKMSPAAKAKLSAKLKAIWAARKAANKQTPSVVQKSKGRGKMSSAQKAKLSAKLKAIWAARKAAKK